MNNLAFRLAVITLLAQQRAGFGRTALMKLMYFLQMLRGVPLGYRFRLYTYGPYDAQVLEDLKLAEMSRGVLSGEKHTAVGIGYAIQLGDRAAEVISSSDAAVAFRPEIDSVAIEFAARSAMDLEMASTIIFMDRLHRERNEVATPEGIAREVKSLKPRLNLGQIVQEVRSLREKGYMEAIS
jgi:uncharacterized protein YwgA